MSAALAFSHGANDAQKSIGVIAALLLAAGDIDTPAAPLWAKLACAAALTVGTTMGGWRIIRTVGRGIYRIQAVDGLASQTASAGVILGCLDRGRAGVDDPGGRLVGDRRRRGAQALAPRALGDRAPDGPGVGDHDSGDRPARRLRGRTVGVVVVTRRRRWFLPETPDVLGLLRSQVAVTLEGLDAFGAWAAGDAGRGGAGARRRAPRGRGQARAAHRAASGVRHPAGARGRVRALARHRPSAQPRAGAHQRVRGDGLPTGREDRRDGVPARRRSAAHRHGDRIPRRRRRHGNRGRRRRDHTGAAARACLLRGHGRPAPNRATATSASHAASSTGAALGSARPSSTSPSVSSTPS